MRGHVVEQMEEWWKVNTQPGTQLILLLQSLQRSLMYRCSYDCRVRSWGQYLDMPYASVNPGNFEYELVQNRLAS